MNLRVESKKDLSAAGTLEKSAADRVEVQRDNPSHMEDYNSIHADKVEKTDLGADGGPGMDVAPARSAFIRVLDCLQSDGEVSGHVAYDVSSDTRVVTGPLPWDEEAGRRPWRDDDSACLRARLEGMLGSTVSARNLSDALAIVFRERIVNPISELFDSLPPADGADHVTDLFTRLLGAEPSPYIAEVAGLLLRAIVTRAYFPGAKYDHMVVLQGPEGIGKSTFCRALALDDRYFLDGVDDLGDIRRAGECMVGKIVVEVGELAGMTGRSREAVKAAITRTKDTYRGAYRRDAGDHLRTAVLIGTTNESGILAYGEKNRRFLPIRCGTVEQVMHPMSPEARREVELAYAQVIAEMRTEGGLPGARPLVLSARGEEAAVRVRDDYEEVDPQADAIRAYLEDCVSHGVVRVSMTMVMSEALGIEGKAAKRINSKTGAHIAAILDSKCPGWHRMPGRQRVGREKSARAWQYTGN